MCGDLNIDIKSNDKNKQKNKKEFNYFLEQQGMYTVTDDYTREMGYCRLAIDHIITNVSSKLIESKRNVEVGISDHYLQYVSFKSIND